MRVLLAMAAALTLVACRSAPTTVLLRIEAASGLPYPDELRLSVHADEGRVVGDEKLAAAALPGEVVLYPRQDRGVLRILVRARSKGGPVGEGTTTASLQAGRQVRATLTVGPGALPDADGDGVPDAIDNCPAVPNPAQGPCAGLDGAVERGELGDG
ncbi:MAG: thrombospondin type 3 repeat-containing protein, partial [Acidobacteriota bacterium]